MKIRYLLLPFSILYGLVIGVRNFLYNRGWFSAVKFELPVIVVGNLEAGGAGKTPVTEYLIRLLSEHGPAGSLPAGQGGVAVLSRGYGRKTRGYLHAGADADAERIGDEPFQYYTKFRNITVAVCENRPEGVARLQDTHEVLVLDDAYQHRRLKPGLSVLVMDYHTLNKPRLLLPAGNYRESFRGRKRADVILVTKTPRELSEAERASIRQRIKPYPHQRLFFSFLRYDPPVPLHGTRHRPEGKEAVTGRETAVLLLTGIARPAPLFNYLKEKTGEVVHLKYPDHHAFTLKNIANIAVRFHAMEAADKVIITTEKDAMRLKKAAFDVHLKALPVYYIPVRACIHDPGKPAFDELILNYVRQGKGNG